MPDKPDSARHTTDRPNILLFLCDQLTARVMRLYGGPAPMPNVERLAAGGVVFRRAYASSVACGPSRAGLFTGQYPHAHGIAHNVDRRDYSLAPWIDRVPPTEEGIRAADTTLGSCLHATGYDSRYYGKWHLLGAVRGHRARAAGRAAPACRRASFRTC